MLEGRPIFDGDNQRYGGFGRECDKEVGTSIGEGMNWGKWKLQRSLNV